MKKWLVSSCVLVLFSAKAQTVYVDPFTSGAMLGYSVVLEDGQNAIKEEQSDLKYMQGLVAVGVQALENTQNKLLKGFQEVNTTISNGIQIKNIGKEIVRIYKVAQDLTQLIADNPEYSIFGVKATEKAYEQAIDIGTEVANIVQSNENNLMSAGDRLRILERIHSKVSHFRFLLQVIHYSIERAIRIGWWRSINPFQSYINTDRDIIENIMDRYDGIF